MVAGLAAIPAMVACLPHVPRQVSNTALGRMLVRDKAKETLMEEIRLS